MAKKKSTPSARSLCDELLRQWYYPPPGNPVIRFFRFPLRKDYKLYWKGLRKAAEKVFLGYCVDEHGYLLRDDPESSSSRVIFDEWGFVVKVRYALSEHGRYGVWHVVVVNKNRLPERLDNWARHGDPELHFEYWAPWLFDWPRRQYERD